METDNAAGNYVRLIGKLIANLSSLEFVLRGYLYSESAPPHTPFPLGKTLDNYNVGELVPLNAMSCYDTLGMLIDRYNKLVKLEYQIDTSIVKLRDALAHGRITADDPEGHFVVVKTTKPDKAGNVQIAYRQELTHEWLETQVKHLAAEIRKVLSIPGFQPEEILSQFASERHPSSK